MVNLYQKKIDFNGHQITNKWINVT